jgi:hypothetical protein
MRLYWVLGALCVTVAGAAAQDLGSEIWQLESSGDAPKALESLERAVEAAPGDPAALRAYAEFLDRHRDPSAREAYSKLALALARSGASANDRAQVARRLTILDLVAGDRPSAARHIEEYRASGGVGLTLPQAASIAPNQATIEVPGPLRSFSRMAALSPEAKPEDLLPALARNVVTNGYQAGGAKEALEPTEYLKLILRYLSQARELERLAGDKKILRVDTCDSTETSDLLRILGYRMRGGCGSDVVLETVNASRAFLTIDSGFPVTELEQALRTNRPFALDYHPTRIPVLYTPEYWQSAKDRTAGEFIDYFLSDPSLCRLYLGLSKLDPATSQALRDEVPAPRLKVFAHVVDFYGAMFQIRDGRAVVPGGARSEKAWSDLVGVSPEKGAAFFERLIARDDGWIASYFDALARINGPVKEYLTEPERLKRFYTAIHGRVTSPGPARPVFRANTDMLLLTTRLRMDPDGKPHLPGDLSVWKNLFADHPHGKYDAKLTRAAGNWKDADDVLEALFGLSRKALENEPLKIFMALSDVERNRAQPLATATVARLALEYRSMSAQYPLFAEAPSVSDKTILAFLDVAHALGQIRDPILRADAVGSMQALAGLWQIFVRQGAIASGDADHALADVLGPFEKVQSERDVFDGGRAGVQALLTATHSPADVSAQDRILNLIAGVSGSENSDVQQQVLADMLRVFESQRLIPLQALFDLADDLDAARPGKSDVSAAQKMAARIAEIQLPKRTLGNIAENSLALGYWGDRHIDAQRKLNLHAAIEKAGGDPQKLKDVRAALGPLLRDTLVGLNYIHYAPPAAQVLYTNPVFVRSHDFIGSPNSPQTWKATDVSSSGWPSNNGGRLSGSLASLPYALAQAEQNFLIPTREQALIWGDLVPQMILSAVIPRWWNVTPLQLHWVGTHMTYAETLLAEGALDAERRKQVLAALDRYASPARTRTVERLLAEGDVGAAEENIMPSEMYQLAADLAPDDRTSPLATDIRRMAAQAPEALSARTISHAFGTPKPTLANSYQPELLNLRTFPTLMGYSSRILAESWESNLLYYAALADETHIRPAELNVLVPAWTQRTVEAIFATHLEDWPALLRSLRMVGDDVRQKARKPAVALANN